MKRIILCILCCLLLLTWTGAAPAEKCPHENQVECSVTKGWEDLTEGHEWVETRSCVCDDCGKQLIHKSHGGLVGHEFHLSESNHYEAEGVHIWVFICPMCYHVTLIEAECAGGDQCYFFQAEVGENPPVTYPTSLEEDRQLTTQDYVKHWIAQGRIV